MNANHDLNGATLQRLHELGGTAFVIEMIDLFFSHVPEQLARACGADDLAVVEQAAHSLKSSAGGIGAEALHKLAARIEIAARADAGRTEELAAWQRELGFAYARVVPLLEVERKKLNGA